MYWQFLPMQHDSVYHRQCQWHHRDCGQAAATVTFNKKDDSLQNFLPHVVQSESVKPPSKPQELQGASAYCTSTRHTNNEHCVCETTPDGGTHSHLAKVCHSVASNPSSTAPEARDSLNDAPLSDKSRSNAYLVSWTSSLPSIPKPRPASSKRCLWEPVYSLGSVKRSKMEPDEGDGGVAVVTIGPPQLTTIETTACMETSGWSAGKRSRERSCSRGGRKHRRRHCTHWQAENRKSGTHK